MLAAAAALAGCGGAPSNTQPQVDVGPRIDAPIQLADCHDWNQSDVEQRIGTIKQIRDFSGGPVGAGGRGAVLDDKQAYDAIDGYCKSPVASAFKLYRIYGRVAAFAGH